MGHWAMADRFRERVATYRQPWPKSKEIFIDDPTEPQRCCYTLPREILGSFLMSSGRLYVLRHHMQCSVIDYSRIRMSCNKYCWLLMSLRIQCIMYAHNIGIAFWLLITLAASKAFKSIKQRPGLSVCPSVCLSCLFLTLLRLWLISSARTPPACVFALLFKGRYAWLWLFILESLLIIFCLWWVVTLTRRVHCSIRSYFCCCRLMIDVNLFNFHVERMSHICQTFQGIIYWHYAIHSVDNWVVLSGGV